MSISILPSARARDAQSNLEYMIEAGQKSHAFGPVDWDAPIWIDPVVKQRPVTEGRSTKCQFYFITGEGGARGAKVGEPMRKPFVDFLKAGLRLNEDAKSKAWTRHNQFIIACRPLHDVLSDVDYDPCRALPRHFDAALKSLSAKMSPGSAYATGATLSVVSGWIDKYGIGRVHIGWKNPLKPIPTSDRHTEAAAEKRANSLPSQAALDALPLIANLVEAPADILRMRTVELLCCGGWRINEVLQIPADCEVTEAVTRNGKEVIDALGQQVIRYGVRYHALKGFGYTIKWIPTPMVDVAKRAVADIRRLTQPVRDDAIWIHQNPGHHPIFKEIDPDRMLTTAEVRELLDFTNAFTARQWLAQEGVPLPHGYPGDPVHFVRARAADVERALLGRMREVHEGARLKLHEMLFLIRINATHRNKREIGGSVEMLTAPKIRDFITGSPGTPAIFGQFGFTEPDGSPITVRSHQFRHWTNTLAQEGGLSQELVARWSGRKDVKQNATYDHISGTKLAEKVRAMAEAGEVVGQMARVRESLPVADRVEFMKTQVATAHVTELGVCVHDWSLVPCEVHGQCATCVEHVVEKGNEAQSSEARRQLGEVEVMLAVAEQEDADGTYGAARWVASHRRRREGLQAVVAIHDDASIADGTMVHLGK